MQQTSRFISLTFNNLSRLYYILIGSVIIFFLIVINHKLCTYQYNITHLIKTINLHKSPFISTILKKYNNNHNFTPKDIAKDKIDNNRIYKINVCKYIILTGDTLSTILIQHHINILCINQLIAMDKELYNLKIGQQLFWQSTINGDVQRLIWTISHHKTRIYNRVNKNKINNILQHGYWITDVIKGTIIHNSFVISARNVGLTNSAIHAVIQVMQWQVDCYKLRNGDQFSVMMYNTFYYDKCRRNKLIGMRLYVGGKNYYAIRADNNKFYDLNGASIAHRFLRFPTVKQFRISSHFNLHRLNPITGRISPHRGVDFAMPQGTQILAVSDGEVIVAKRSSAAGLYITVRHGHAYMTRYMHLHKLLVKNGQKVKMGDRIALSGNTGHSTGPHLHYEVWINRHAVDPITAKLPCTEWLTGKYLNNYLNKVKDIAQYLCF